jgi:serine/threonine-protein phosphatase 2A activator
MIVTIMTKVLVRGLVETREDLEAWRSSPCYGTLWKTICLLNDAVRGKRRGKERSDNPIVREIVGTFGKLREILGMCPALENCPCFSNPGYRKWQGKMVDRLDDLLSGVTDNPEVHEYFANSFGNGSRLDFGTGHELFFLAFVACLLSLGILHESDAEEILFKVFWEYWDFFIALQSQYHLEPAGSAGAWGLDDFVALPFVFGSAQLVADSTISPHRIIDREMACLRCDDNAYCKWIEYLYQSKAGSFSEHSRGLYSLKVVPDFEKLNEGMLKTYERDVLMRLFVVQQFGFGEILKFRE